MALNFPGPYEVRIHYTTDTYKHVQKLNLRVVGNPAPGTEFEFIDALDRNDDVVDLDTAVDDWVALLQPVMDPSETTIDYAELWKYTSGSFDASFVSTYPIAVPGTSASSYRPAGQAIWTFRTAGGGIMKVNIMESTFTPTFSDSPPYGAFPEAISQAVYTGTSPWLGRDDTYPFAPIGFYPGTNEALFKRRYR